MFPNHIKSGILCELALACRSLADLDQHNYYSRVWSGDFVEVFLKPEKVPKIIECELNALDFDSSLYVNTH